MQDLTSKSLRDLRPMVREALVLVGRFEAVVADEYIAQELRDVAYRWGNHVGRPVATRGVRIANSLHVEFSTWCKEYPMTSKEPAPMHTNPPTLQPAYLSYLEEMPRPDEGEIQLGTEMTFTVIHMKPIGLLGDVEIVLRYDSSK
jgi:hypothetical protein